MIGCRRLEFGGTQGRMELDEPLMNSFFLGLPLRALKGNLVTERFWLALAFFLSSLFYPPRYLRIECSFNEITHYSLNCHVKIGGTTTTCPYLF